MIIFSELATDNRAMDNACARYVPDMSLKLITKIGNLDAFRQQLHEALDQDFEVSENR